MKTIEQATRESIALNAADHRKKTGGEVTGCMTLRDYFATSVMNALISRGDWESDNDPEFYATWSYEMADAMLETRK